MLNRISNILTYAVLVFLCVVGVREAYTYVSYDLLGKAARTVPAQEPEQRPAGAKTLKLLTYNVLYHEVALDLRARPLMKILGDSGADIIALQEAGMWFVERLPKEDWAKKYHHVGAEHDCGGQFILSKIAPEKAICFGLPGRQGRRVLIATFRVDGRLMAVATSHLDSPLQDTASRARQIGKVIALMESAGAPDDLVFMADFNFGDNAPEEKSIPAGYVDLWKAVRKGDPGFTWDNEKSDMAGKSPERFPGEQSRRLDKILVKSAVWKPAAVRIVGDAPVVAGRKDVFPSDHFGVAGVVRREQ